MPLMKLCNGEHCTAVWEVHAIWLTAILTQASAVEGSVDLFEESKRSLTFWPALDKILQCFPTLAPSSKSHPGSSTLPQRTVLLLPAAELCSQGLSGSLIAVLIHCTFRKSHCKIIYNSGGHIFSYIGCHFCLIREKFQDMWIFQTRKRLTFSVLARCFNSRLLLVCFLFVCFIYERVLCKLCFIS